MIIDNHQNRSLVPQGMASASSRKDQRADQDYNATLLKTLSQNLNDKIRSPIFVLKAYTQLLRQTDDPNIIERGLKLMEAATVTINRIMNSYNKLADIYANENQEPMSIYFKQAFFTVKSLLAEEFECDKIEYIVDFSCQSKIWFSPMYLKEILSVYISNAIVHNQKLEAITISISSFRMNDKIVLQVKDNGLGVNLSRVKDNVKDPFNNLSENKECLGTGLSKVEAIAKVTGNTFTFESDLGKGATSSFLFQQ